MAHPNSRPEACRSRSDSETTGGIFHAPLRMLMTSPDISVDRVIRQQFQAALACFRHPFQQQIASAEILVLMAGLGVVVAVSVMALREHHHHLSLGPRDRSDH